MPTGGPDKGVSELLGKVSTPAKVATPSSEGGSSSSAAPPPPPAPFKERSESEEEEQLEKAELYDDHGELTEKGRRQIVPRPRLDRDSRKRREARSVPHILIHKPAMPEHCEICRRAKLRETPHRKGSFGESQSAESEAEEFGDCVTSGFLASKGDFMLGIGEWTNAMNMLDIGSGNKMCYPTVA